MKKIGNFICVLGLGLGVMMLILCLGFGFNALCERTQLKERDYSDNNYKIEVVNNNQNVIGTYYAESYEIRKRTIVLKVKYYNVLQRHNGKIIKRLHYSFEKVLIDNVRITSLN